MRYQDAWVVEKTVMYRETCNAEIDNVRSEDVRLRQHSTSDPWIVLGLGVMLAVLLTYLIYANVLFPPAPPSSPEHSMRVLDDPSSWRGTLRAQEAHPSPEPPPPSKKASAQNRTPYALLGGQGPASPPSYSRDTSTP
jgi:hypothetical protein